MGCCLPKYKRKTFIEPFVPDDMIVKPKKRRRLCLRKKLRNTRRHHHQRNTSSTTCSNSKGVLQPNHIQNDQVLVPVNHPFANCPRPVVVVNNDNKKNQTTIRDVHSINSVPSHIKEETKQPRQPSLPPPVPMDFSVFISNPSPPIITGSSTSSSSSILTTTNKKHTLPSIPTGSSVQKLKNKQNRPKSAHHRRCTTVHTNIPTMEEYNKIFAPPDLVLQDVEDPNIEFGRYTNRCQTPNGVSFDLVFDDTKPHITKPALHYPSRLRQHKAKTPAITKKISQEATTKVVGQPLKKELAIEERLPTPLYPTVIYVQPLTSSTDSEEGNRSATCTSDSSSCKPSPVEETVHDTAQVVNTVTDENMSEDIKNVQGKVCSITSSENNSDIISTSNYKHIEMPSTSISFSSQNNEDSTFESSVTDEMIACDENMEPQTDLEKGDDIEASDVVNDSTMEVQTALEKEVDLEESDDCSFASIDDDSISLNSFSTCNSDEDTFSFLSSYDSEDEITDDTITTKHSPANNYSLSPDDKRFVDQFIRKRFRIFWRMHRKEKIVVHQSECPDDDEIFHDLFPPKKQAPVKRKRLREFPFMHKNFNTANYLDKYYGTPASSSPVGVSGQRFEGSYIDVKVTTTNNLKKDDTTEGTTVTAKDMSDNESSSEWNPTAGSESTENVKSSCKDSNPQQELTGKEDDEEQTFIAIMNNFTNLSVRANDEVEDDFSFNLPAVSSEDSKTADDNTLVDSAGVEEPKAENKTRRTVRFNLQPEIRTYYPETDDESLQSDLEDDIELTEF